MKLSPRLIGLFLALSILPLSIVATLSYVNSQRSMEQAAYAHLESINLLKQNEVERWLADSATLLASIAQRPLLREQIGWMVASSPDDQTYQAAMRKLITDYHLTPAKEYAHSLEDLSIIRASDSMILAATMADDVGKYRDAETYFQEGKKGTYIDTVRYFPNEGIVVLHVSTPLLNPAGETVAVLSGHLDLGIVSDIMTQGSKLVSSQDTYLVNDFSFFVTEPRFGQGSTLNTAVHTPGIDACLAQKTNIIGLYDDYRGVKVVGSYHWLPERRMVLVTEIDQSEAFAAIKTLRQWVVGLALVVAAVVAVLGVVFARSITVPIEQLAQGAAAIGRGELDRRIDIQSKDEIGELARTFNETAQSLRQSRSETQRRQQLLLALSQAAQAVQRAQTPEEIYARVSEAIKALGFDAMIFEIEEGGDRLTLTQATFASEALQAIQDQAGFSLIGYSFPVLQGGVHDRLLHNGDPVFFADAAEPLGEAMPEELRPAARGLASLLGAEQAVFVALRVDEETEGLLAMTGSGLSEADVPAVATFASQTAVALETARAAEALHASQERLEYVISSSPVAIYSRRVSGDYGVTFFSDSVGLLVGYDPQAFLADPTFWASRIHPEDAPRVLDGLAEKYAQGQYADEYRFRHENDGYVWIHDERRLTRDAQGQPLEIVGSWLDVTERVESELELGHYRDHLEQLVEERSSQLMAANQHLQEEMAERARTEVERTRAVSERAAIVDALSDGLFVMDMEGTLTSVNAAFERMVGLAEKEMVGQNLAAIIGRVVKPGETDGPFGAMSTVLSGQPYTPGSTTLLNPDGSQVPIIYSSSFMFDAEGAPRAVITTLKDITEVRKVEDELRQTMANLQRSNRELEQFAYVASHDLQEPLRMVASYTQLLARRYKDKLDEDAMEFIAYAVDGANRMQRLINDLLSYSRVTTRGGIFRQTDSQSALGQAIANLQRAIEDSGAMVTSDGLPVLVADEGQMMQIFQNLISNAIKFRGPEPPRIHVAASRQGHEWVFGVRDNGMGIEPQYFERIFIIFQRLHARNDYPGTGIGLAVCKRIVERHGGRIWVESQDGQGSTFYFTVPTTLRSDNESH